MSTASPAADATAPAGGVASGLVDKIEITNFKSIDKLTLELGRVTVLIGENGCGKTNLLEAVGLGAAAAAGKLDREFLLSRGLRVPSPELMRSGFDKSAIAESIVLDFWSGSKVLLPLELYNDNQP